MAQKSIIDIPLCVDLDQTLIRTDLIIDTMMLYLIKNPLNFIHIILWLLKGTAYLKNRLASSVKLDVKSLPYNNELLEFLKQEKARGRKLVLATAADMQIAQAIASHIGLFDEVLASDGKTNLKGTKKLELLREKYGENGFDYAGDAYVDLEIWEHANSAIAINPSERLLSRIKKHARISKVFDDKKNQALVFFKAFRVSQWVKNILIFIPIFTAHKINFFHLFSAATAFLSFSFAASGIYLINDLCDIQADRCNPQKKHRPLASGDLSVFRGIVSIPVLLLLSIALALLLPFDFLALIIVYIITAITYSLFLKRIIMVDVMVLAGFYSLRIVAGGKATGTSISFWLLAFSMFIFISLGAVKRFVELKANCNLKKDSIEGRGYHKVDMHMISIFGIVSGYCSSIVLALYINSSSVIPLYSNPMILWFIVPVVIYWISRVWLIAGRGLMPGDPIAFATRDPISYVTCLLVISLTLAAI